MEYGRVLTRQYNEQEIKLPAIVIFRDLLELFRFKFFVQVILIAVCPILIWFRRSYDRMI